MRNFLLWFTSFVAVAGVLGGYLFHPAFYLVGVPAWVGITLRQLYKEVKYG